nr:MAG TPA: major capsid protein [Caudoviricetes sp.]
MEYDFSGYATRNDIKCSDGRIIRQDAFKECDHKKVPLVWQHDHMTPDNVLGHAMLENREDGVYAYGTFNNTPSGQNAKECVINGDVNALSIYANKLRQNGSNVIHGAIREVSLVLAGANPGAYIDTVLVHDYDDEEEAEICFNEPISLAHAEDETKDETVAENNNEETVQDVIDSMNEKQKNVLYALVGMAAEDDGEVQHAETDDSEETVQDVIDSMNEKQKNVLYALVGMAAEGTGDNNDNVEGDEDMKHNVFETDTDDNTLAHAEVFDEILRDAKRFGSLKESAIQHGYADLETSDVLAHADYGITDINYLFPDYKNVTNTPGFVSREMGWVENVMRNVSHTPFSRIKTVFANITEDEARAKGYIKGKQKKEEVFPLLKRTTDPQTVYKKQKLDRDDVIDIVDFDVVVWLKGEMRLMLDEEIARAIMVGDGRTAGEEDKISEDHIRPIWGDDPFYTIRAQVELDTSTSEDDKYKTLIRAAIKARKNYKGSGNPTFYTTEDNLTGMLLLTDTTGRDLYESAEQLAKKLRVKEIITVPVMENLTRTADSKDGGLTGKTMTFEGLIVNLKDYNVGADKGGAVSMFDDFDIDYNQQKYLIETRCSGALIKPYAAIALETYPKA